MSDKPAIYIERVNLDDGWIVTTCHKVLPITKYLDFEGHPCEADAAVVGIAGAHALWVTFEIARCPTTVSVH